MTPGDIRERLCRNEIPYGEDVPEKLAVYMKLLEEWNTKIDLIAPAEEDEVLDRHFIDSLAVLKTGLLPETGRVIDVGTGMSLPGSPAARQCFSNAMASVVVWNVMMSLSFFSRIIPRSPLPLRPPRPPHPTC